MPTDKGCYDRSGPDKQYTAITPPLQPPQSRLAIQLTAAATSWPFGPCKCVWGKGGRWPDWSGAGERR